MKQLAHSVKCIITAAALLVLAGCENSLVVKGEFPTPIVDKLPLTLGVVYEKAFSDYVYVEKSEDRSKWTIDNGAAQTQLFDTILPGMFESVVKLAAIPGHGDDGDVESEKIANGDIENGNIKSEQGQPEQPSVQEAVVADLILSPLVDEFQYAMPRETKVNVFEIWIKYNMRVYTPDGQLIADWIITAYGKTPTAFMKSKEEALNEAVVMALRDVGASLSLGFRRVPEIRAWLEQHNRAMLTNSDTTPG